MKIIQLNTWMGKFGIPMLDFLEAENPDIICLQEVIDLKDKSGLKFFATLDDIQNRAGLSERFISPTFSANYMQRKFEYGNAILSKLTVISKETIFTRGEYTKDYDATLNDTNTRNLQVAKISINGKTLNILNHHGYHIPGSKLGDAETARQMTIIAKVIDGLEGPVILCGDFNLTPGSESLKIIDSKLINLSVKNNLETTCTNPFTDIHGVLDYIFVNDDIKVSSFEASDALVSDHKALVMEFGL